LNQKTFRSAIQDSNALFLQNLTKKSIANGIKVVYQEVSNQKWKKITELCAVIVQQMDLEQLPEPEAPIISAIRSAETDELAIITTESFCKFYRSA
jgi:hypothetical protein